MSTTDRRVVSNWNIWRAEGGEIVFDLYSEGDLEAAELLVGVVLDPNHADAISDGLMRVGHPPLVLRRREV